MTVDYQPLKDALSAAVDTFAAGQPAPVVPPAPAPPVVPPAPTPAPPVPVPAPQPVVTAGPAYGEVPGWENGIRYGNDADTNTRNLAGLMTELGQQGGGTIRLNAAGAPYQINGKIPLFSGVSLLRSSGVKFAYTGDPNLNAIFESPPEDTLVDCALDIWIDEGSAYAGEVLRLHSGSLIEARIIGLGQSPASMLYHITADSTGGEGRQGGRNFFASRIVAKHLGVCGTLGKVEGIPNGYGGQPQVVTLNEFADHFGANCVHRGMTLPAWADNNVCTGSHRVAISGQGGIGLAVNEENPSVETGVYAWTWDSLAVDTWGATPGGPLGRTGVFIGASKIMECGMFHQQPPAELGALRLHPNAISVYWRGRPGNENTIVMDERDVAAINV